MNFELLTFPCREMVHTYVTSFQNESIYIRKTHILCDACIVYIDIATLQMRFLYYAFFKAKSHVLVQFSWPYFGELNEICNG